MTQVRMDPIALDPQGIARTALPTAPSQGTERAEREQAAQEFEAYFVKMLLEEMQKTVRSGGLFEAESPVGYRALVDDALARRAAQAGSFGLAHKLLEQWEGEP